MSNLLGVTVALRVDASLEIGTGHVMRCLALANALASAGATCHFICREHPGNLIDYLRRQGHVVLTLPATEIYARTFVATLGDVAHATWLGCDWPTDARETLEALQFLRQAHASIDWLIVDSYALDHRWEEFVHSHCNRILAIDDLADRLHVCELLLDQSIGRTPEHYTSLVPPNCVILTGPQFALLRPEFRSYRQKSLQRRTTPRLQRLLVTMGGVDQPNATTLAIDALGDCALPSTCEIVIIIGTKSRWTDAISASAARLPWKVTLLTNVRNMAELMASSDLAIGAAGTTALERCCLGLPSLLVVLADNQKAGAYALQTHGAARLLGPPESIASNLPRELESLLQGNTLLQMSKAAESITDGTGISRVIQRMADSP